MIKDLLSASGSLSTLAVALIIFGLAPGIVLSWIVKMVPDLERRKELQAELYAVPRWERPFWVAEQLEVAIRVGLLPELRWYWCKWFWHRCRLVEGPHFTGLHQSQLDEAIGELRAGDFVKIGWSVDRAPLGEWMWVEITHIGGHNFTGRLANSPFVAYMTHGEEVRFGAKDVWDLKFSDGEWA